MSNKEYEIINIRDYLIDGDEKIGEESLRKKLSDFTCPMNLNVEQFLKEKAIEFTKRNQSVTYLVFLSDASTLVGYFTLALKSITVKEGILSKTIQRKISRVSEYDSEYQTFRLSAYLIAQLGKNFTSNANEKITGHQLMELAIQKVKELQYMLGGTIVFLETLRNAKLMEFYTHQHGFKEFDTRRASSMIGTEFVQLLGTL